ncbi:Internalin-A precursor [Candidatus Izimaplasma bacterium HR1]|jgi:Leucine-rich repeat (LRR) protein|uniref:leucine-rich repeat domain-containing protein n=1 Tax=Candidatus Izimoplasma sp. HR1 TaxID=1541959 RepID=UPI0004F5D0A7|nr:Internalin-A precursor [Candidatus Izimaplasma bacterium HR1]
MKRIFRPLLVFLLLIVVFFASACSRNAENEHLPEYCQTYSGFTSFASKDFYDLLIDSGISINRSDYFDAISVISLTFEVDEPNRSIDLSGIQCFQNLTDISLTGQSFKDLSPISALSNIQSIELIGTNVVSIDSFKNLSKIKSLEISDTRTLQSVDGVEEMTKLTHLDLSNNGIVDIFGLNNLINLRTLYLNDNEIIEFPSINNLEFLEILDISDNNINVLGDDLSGLSNLRTLNAENNEICDLSTLDDLVSLETLILSNNDLGCGGIGVSPNFESLENAPNLIELRLDNNDLTSIEGLRGRDISLTTLYLNDNNLTDITPIAEYTDIIELYLDNNNISSINDLSGMTGLTSIDLSHNSIVDISDLMSIENVEIINLSFNNIVIIPDISAAWGSLTTLDLSSNVLTDTSGVSGHPTLESLILYNNGLTELSGINELPNLDNLVIFDAELEALLEPGDVFPNTITVIRDSFTNVPELPLQAGDNIFDFGFEVEDNLQIYNSINGLTDIATIRFEDMNIALIDELSINIPGLTSIYVENNNLTDIRFILGNPNLERLDISGNPVANLQVISGLSTTDLDNLEEIDASDISADNDIVDAFIDLPSILNINLANTQIVSIDNSFNDLATLNLITFDSDSLETITDSFNNIFATYNSSNIFALDAGKIGVISGSFNNGHYHRIDLKDQITTIITTSITDSFNNLVIENSSGVDLSGSNFETITNSFNNLETSLLLLNDSNVYTITNSFVSSTIDGLNLGENYLQTVPSLDQATSIETLLIYSNLLNTLSFLDGIPGVITLNISDQTTKDTHTATLVSIDGINNMPTLTTLLHANIGVSQIDGLKNIGISEFILSFSDNNDILVDTISATSFTGTDLTELDLGGHQFTDVTFLDNVDNLVYLTIGIDLADLSDFSGQDFELTLVHLTIENLQSITDFVYLSEYDEIINLTIESSLTTTLNNLDGLDKLANLTFDFSQITSIIDSFNNLPDYNPDNDYLVDNYTSLVAITNSFDIYGTASHYDAVEIPASITVTNSFNNLIIVTISTNELDLTPNFDTLSFDNIEEIILIYGDYSSFTFLNGYTLLTDVTIANLNVNIIDLANDSIELLHIISADNAVDTITVDLNANATVNLSSFRTGTITFNTDALSYDVTALNADIVINTSVASLNLSVDVDDLTLNASNVTAIDLNNYQTTNTIFNTDALIDLTRNTTFEVNATTFTINSTVISPSYSTRAANLIINNNIATSYTITVSGGKVTINNTQAVITVNANSTELEISQDTLTDLTLNGSIGIVDISSTNIDNLLGSASITTLNLSTSVASIVVSNNSITTLILTDNNITTLDLSTSGADVELYTTNNQPLSGTVISDVFTLNANNISSVIIETGSNINSLQLSNNNSLDTVNYNDASIQFINIDTNQTTINITGTTFTNITLDGASYTNIVIDASLAFVVVNSSGTVVNANLKVDEITFDNTSLVTLNLNALSVLDEITISNSSSFTTFNSNDVDLSFISFESTETIIVIDATNVGLIGLNGDNFTDVTIDAGDGIVNMNSNNSLPLNLDIISSNFSLLGDTSSITFLGTTDIDTFGVTDLSLTSITSNTANIDTMNIDTSSANLNVSGSNIQTFIIDTYITSLDLILSSTTDVTISSETGVDVTTNTNEITLTASGDSNITSSTLGTIDFDLSTNDLELILNKANLSFSLDGTANQVTLNGTDIDNLDALATTNIVTLVLNTLNVSSLDFTTGNINELVFNTNLNDVSITGDELNTIIVNGDNLNSLTVNSTALSSELTVNSTNGSLDLNGSTSTVLIDNDSLTSLNIDDYTTTDLTLQANSLTSFDDGTSVSSTLSITTNQGVFTLTSDAQAINYSGLTTGTLNLISTNTGNIDTNTETLDLDVTNADIYVSGTNLIQITGNVVSLHFGVSTGTLTLELVATGFVDINGNNITTLQVNSPSNIDTLSVGSTSVSLIDTNDATISQLNYSGSFTNITITTKSDSLNINTSGNAEVTLEYEGATALTLNANLSNELILDIVNSNQLTITGSIAVLEIGGDSLDTITTTSLTVLTSLTMNGTPIDDLEFISNEVLGNIDTITINTLSVSNIETIMAKLDGTSITLVSPLVDNDIYDFYYDEEYTRLYNLETSNNARYDAFRTTAINEAWAEILTNQYMDHLDETLTKAEIDAQIYQSVQDYYEDYLDDAGINPLDVTPTEETNIKNAIQATLDDALLTLIIGDIYVLVLTSIEEDADTFAIAQQANKTFTLS